MENGVFFMKINKTNKILQIYNNAEFNRLRKGKGKFEKDTIDFSEKAMDYQFAINKLKEVPEMRMDKVEKLKKQVQSGNYNIEGRKIVEKMYESINFDKKI